MPQRTLRTPPEPGTTSPASGWAAMKATKELRSSSDQYSSTSRWKRGVSTTVYTEALYGVAVSTSSGDRGRIAAPAEGYFGGALVAPSRGGAMIEPEVAHARHRADRGEAQEHR